MSPKQIWFGGTQPLLSLVTLSKLSFSAFQYTMYFTRKRAGDIVWLVRAYSAQALMLTLRLMRDREENNPAVMGTTEWPFHFWSELWARIRNLHSPLYMIIKNSSEDQNISQKQAEYNLWYLLSWYTCVYSLKCTGSRIECSDSGVSSQKTTPLPSSSLSKDKAQGFSWMILLCSGKRSVRFPIPTLISGCVRACGEAR